VVDVSVGSDRRKRIVEKILRGSPETGDTHAGIDQQVAFPASHMPDVALLDADDVRLPQPGDAIGKALPLEPAVGDL
jgi:hypothetical protein